MRTAPARHPAGRPQDGSSRLLASVLAALLAVVLPGGLRGQAASGDTAALEARLAELDAELALREGALSGPIPAGLARLREARSAAQEDLDQVESAIGRLRQSVRSIDTTVAANLSLYEKAAALKKFRDAGRSAEAFREFFQTLRGQPPDRATMASFDIQAMILERECTVEGVVKIGRALILLADVVLKIPGLAMGGIRVSPRDLFRGSEIFTKATPVEKLLEYLTGAGFLGPAAGFVSDFFGPSGSALLAELLGQISGSLGTTIALTTNGRGMANAKAAAIYDDMEARSRKEFPGPEDRDAAMDAARSYRATLEELATELSGPLPRLREQISRLDARIEFYRQRFDAAREDLARLKQEREQLGFRIEDARLLAADRDAREAFARTHPGPGADRPNTLELAMPREFHAAGARLAADDATAGLLRLPRTVTFRAPASQLRLDREECSFTTRGASGPIERTGTRQVLRPGPAVPHLAAAKVSGRGLSVSGTRLTAVAAVNDVIVARAEGIVGIRSANHPCGSEPQPRSGTLESAPVRFQALEVADITYAVEPEGSPLGDRVDFFADYSGMGRTLMERIEIRPAVTVSDGSTVSAWNEPIRTIDLFGHLAGSQVATVRGDERTLRIAGSSVPGKATLQLGLPSDGSLLFPRKLDLTANAVFVEVEPEVRLAAKDKDDQGIRVPMGSQVELVVRVEGPADLSAYRVQWTGADPDFELPRETGFQRANGVWTSRAKAVFPVRLGTELEPGRKVTKVVQPRLRILRRDDGREVYDATLPSLERILPVLRGFEIGLRDPGFVGALAVPLFFPMDPGAARKKLGLALEFEGVKGAVVAPFRFASRSRVIGPAAQLVLAGNDGLEVGRDRGDGVADAGSGETGEAHLVVELHEDEAGAGDLVLAQPVLDDTLAVPVNKLAVSRREKGFRLRVFGPTDLEGFTARWRLSRGREIPVPMRRAEGRWVSDLDAEGVFMEVRLLDPGGKAVGRVSLRDGTPLPEPELSLEVPSGTRAGSSVVVRLRIENLSFRQTEDFVAVWEVPEDVGKFRSLETPVLNDGPSRATSVNTLEIAASLPAGVADLDLGVKLFRKLSGGRR